MLYPNCNLSLTQGPCAAVPQRPQTKDQTPQDYSTEAYPSGRSVLIKIVLCTIPVHQLLAIAPDKKVGQAINKIRGFLWEGRKDKNGATVV